MKKGNYVKISGLVDCVLVGGGRLTGKGSSELDIGHYGGQVELLRGAGGLRFGHSGPGGPRCKGSYCTGIWRGDRGWTGAPRGGGEAARRVGGKIGGPGLPGSSTSVLALRR